jgi:hypothetical protein
VAEVPAAALADNLGALHEEAVVGAQLDVLGVLGLVEAGPAGARFKLGLGVKELGTARSAGVRGTARGSTPPSTAPPSSRPAARCSFRPHFVYRPVFLLGASGVNRLSAPAPSCLNTPCAKPCNSSGHRLFPAHHHGRRCASRWSWLED